MEDALLIAAPQPQLPLSPRNPMARVVLLALNADLGSVWMVCAAIQLVVLSARDAMLMMALQALATMWLKAMIQMEIALPGAIPVIQEIVE